jgi:hypothetical protein
MLEVDGGVDAETARQASMPARPRWSPAPRPSAAAPDAYAANIAALKGSA